MTVPEPCLREAPPEQESVVFIKCDGHDERACVDRTSLENYVVNTTNAQAWMQDAWIRCRK